MQEVKPRGGGKLSKKLQEIMAGNLALSENTAVLTNMPQTTSRVSTPITTTSTVASPSVQSGIAVNIGTISSLGQLRQALNNQQIPVTVVSTGTTTSSTSILQGVTQSMATISGNSLLSQPRPSAPSHVPAALTFQPIGTMSMSAASNLAASSKSSPSVKTSFIAIPKSALSSSGSSASLIPSILTSISSSNVSNSSAIPSLIVASPSGTSGKQISTKGFIGSMGKTATLVQTSTGTKLFQVTQKYDRKQAVDSTATIEQDKVQAIQKLQFHDFPLTTASLSKNGNTHVITQAKILSKKNIELGKLQAMGSDGATPISTSAISSRVKSLLLTSTNSSANTPVVSASVVPQFAQLAQNPSNKAIFTLTSPIRKMAPQVTVVSGASVLTTSATTSLQPQKFSVAINRNTNQVLTTHSARSASLLSTALTGNRQSFTPVKVVSSSANITKQLTGFAAPRTTVSKVKIQLPTTVTGSSEPHQTLTVLAPTSSSKNTNLTSSASASVPVTSTGDNPAISHAVLAGADAKEQERVLEAAHILLLTSGLVTMRENKTSQASTSSLDTSRESKPVTTMLVPADLEYAGTRIVQTQEGELEINSATGMENKVKQPEDEISIVYSDTSDSQNAASMAIRSHHSYSRQPSVSSGRGRGKVRAPKPSE